MRELYLFPQFFRLLSELPFQSRFVSCFLLKKISKCCSNSVSGPELTGLYPTVSSYKLTPRGCCVPKLLLLYEEG
jgi:hypothetical protein